MQNNKKILLTVFLSLALLLVLPMMSAATAIVKPVTNTNYTGTMNVTVTTAIVGTVGGSLNVTCWRNTTGALTLLTNIQNTSAGQTWFSNPTVDISGIPDGLKYNITCGAFGDTTENATILTKVGIDNTNPVVTLSVMRDKLNAGNTQELTWTSSDATAGLTSTLVTLSSPNSDSCADQTWSTATGTNQQVVTDGGVASCPGTWTATIVATDKAGNIGTDTVTYTAEDVAGKKIGNLGLEQDSGTAKTGLSPIVLIIAGIVIYFLFFSKKKGK